MKLYATIFLLLSSCYAYTQKRPANYRSIDWEVMTINAGSVDALAIKLTSTYKTDLEKVRSIYAWIAQNISYNYKAIRSRSARGGSRSKSTATHPVEEAEDDTSSLVPLNQIVAENVLRKRTAICDGYARLFKTLCDMSGIPCEIVNGYARGEVGRIGKNFRSNHSWNAVRIDSAWHLLDVTWASGYVFTGTNEFVKHFNDQYFLTPPDQFAEDHFPEDPQWTLLPQPPVLREFQHSPFKGWAFIKYGISSYTPANGIIRATVGDTIQLQFQIDREKHGKIGGGYFNDSVAMALPGTVFLKPLDSLTSNTIHYTFVVGSTTPQWLQLVYNDDMILRYKLEIR